jgi:hypothetical protein
MLKKINGIKTELMITLPATQTNSDPSGSGTAFLVFTILTLYQTKNYVRG